MEGWTLEYLKLRLRVEKVNADEYNGSIKRARRALRFTRKRIVKYKRAIALLEKK
jgi:hypothetical protein